MRRHLGTALLTTLLLTGCTSSSEPAAAPGDPASAEATASGSATTPTDPLTFESVGNSCARLPGRYIMWESFRTNRPLTLTGAEFGAVGGIQITDREVTEQPADVFGLTGMVKGPMPRKDRADLGWSEREPLDGYTVRPGTTYYFFLHARLTMGGSYDGVEVGWDDGEVTGTSRWDDKVEVREDCA